ncbi:MAG: hypothetical protein GY742_22875, partial [Hyphomicrobiales bacterium]|nr:hypothetical protein [Hyphomicrobiales bacterium]
ANSGAVLLSILNSIGVDLRSLVSAEESTYPGGGELATLIGSQNASDVNVIEASANLTKGVSILGRKDVNDILIGTKYADSYFGYQETDNPDKIDTVSFARVLDDLSKGDDGLTVHLAQALVANEYTVPVYGTNAPTVQDPDILFNIERIELTTNPDTLELEWFSLQSDITVDMGVSRRTQEEIAALNENLPDGQTPYVLGKSPEDAYLSNVDTVDYSGFEQAGKGLMYYYGQTAVRTGGGFVEGTTVKMDIEAETQFINGSLKGIHNLKVENVEKIILTDGDDTFAGADKGSIVDLGGGADKVWLRPDILVENFGMDDRLTLFGELALYGGYRNAESELPWAEGVYGTRYAINPALDLVVHNPWAAGNNDYMFITNWQNQKGDVKAVHDAGGYSSGPGDIALSKFSFRSSTLNDLIKGVNPPATEGQEDILGGWALFRFKARTLTGSNLFPENSDPLILDLDGDGFGLEWRNGYSPDFDIDLDLFAENTATLDRDDGFLARDING